MKHPSFPLFPSDLLVGTASMSNEALGSYMRLLCYSWEHDGLPDDQTRLNKLAGNEEVPPCVLAKFKKCEDGNLRNVRMEKERAKMLAVPSLLLEGKGLTSLIPKSLDKDGFPAAWADYEGYRHDIAQPLNNYTRKQLFLKCERMGIKPAIAMIRETIEKSRKSLYAPEELRDYQNGNGKQPEPIKAPKLTPLQIKVAETKHNLLAWETLDIAEQSAVKDFLRSLSQPAIEAYFPEEQIKIKEILGVGNE